MRAYLAAPVRDPATGKRVLYVWARRDDDATARAMAAKKLVLREVPTILVGHLNAVQELADIIANDSKGQ